MAKDSTVRGIWEINGVGVGAPLEHLKAQIVAQFDRNSVQANLDIEELTFVLEGAGIINKWIEDGRTGIGFGINQGIPLKFRIEDKNDSLEVFDGYIDLKAGYSQINPGEVKVKIAEPKNTFTLLKKMGAITYAFLLDRNDVPGSITDSDFFDLDYLVEKKNNPLELTMMGVATFLMVKELAEAIKDLAFGIANVITIATGGFPGTGQAAALILALAQLLIQAAYTAILAVAVIKMIKSFIANFISPIRQHKTIKYRTLLEKGAEYFGLGFSSDIVELDFLYYLPSKPTETEAVKEGIPRADDFGHTVREAFEYILDKFESQMAVIDDVLHLRPLNDPFWRRRAALTIKGTLPIAEQKKYNTDALNSSVIISFRTDSSDTHTLDNFPGTNYQIITSAKNINKQENILLDGLDERDSPFALPNRKNELNVVEDALLGLVQIADGLVRFFGENNSLTQELIRRFNSRIGMLKVSQNIHTVAKLVPVINGKIPANHRELWSAKVLWDGYLNQVSFIKNNFGAQKQPLRGEEIPFGFPSYKLLIDNKFFNDIDGREAEALKISWSFNESVATIDADIDEIYDRNLQETEIEGK